MTAVTIQDLERMPVRFIAARVSTLLSAYRFNFANEKDVQDAIEQIFAAERIAFAREVELDYSDKEAVSDGFIRSADGTVLGREPKLSGRIDFLLGRCGLEVKVGHSWHGVIRQLQRYALCDQVEGLVLVTTRLRHRMPGEIGKKPLYTVNLGYSTSL